MKPYERLRESPKPPRNSTFSKFPDEYYLYKLYSNLLKRKESEKGGGGMGASWMSPQLVRNW
jgi:hypothetical protein